MPIDDGRLAALVTVAHGAGNSAWTAAKAGELGADIVEADIHAYRGRLEVRHLKTLGRLPLLWDRWYLAPDWRPRLVLSELAMELASAPGPAVMLDLKGRDPSLPAAVIEAIAGLREVRRVLVCGQNWALVDRFLAEPDIEVLHSIGTREQLAAFEARPEIRGDGVAIHQRLLNADVARRLRERVPFIATWPINDDATLARVIDYGVTAITTDSDDMVERVRAARDRIAGSSATTSPAAQ